MTFSIQRVLLLIRKDLLLNIRQIVVVAVTIAIIVVLSVLIGGLGSEYGTDQVNRSSLPLYLIILAAGGLIITSRALSDAHNRRTMHDWYMTPASPLEKLLSRFLETSLIWMLASYLLYLAATLFGAGLNLLLFGRSHTLLIPFQGDLLRGFAYYLPIHAIFFLGAAYFRRLNFVKTILMLGVIAITVSLVVGVVLIVTAFFVVADLSGTTAFEHHQEYVESLVTNVELQFIDGAWQASGLGKFVNTLGTLASLFYWLVTPLFCWFVAYLRVKEIESRYAI